MLTITDKQFAFIFSCLLSAELICGSIASLATFHYITKPSLLISLLIYFYTQSKSLNTTTRLITLLALGCSLLGDVFLMFDDRFAIYFILGLLSFLLAHVFYSIVFLKNRNVNRNAFGLSLILLLYALGFFYLLKNSLGHLLIPVIIYMIVILAMVITSYLRSGKLSQLSFILVFIGALLFAISDSILALNKFYMPIHFSALFIMLTYGLAQYLIVLGLLKQR
ncbi:lysoplasmalogenase [Gelidibacter salicanalis]|uniref:Lysoplasmalogenase n=1 Tax=Gelidibacter salicanalis TaxID=291193 RepID=A0A5C7APR3_9FLAO|nr:lysoplasmalogenase [Gelidibacter salicanalis]TXE10578.1 lysoplasmalogenase [Gelidibacter salicanalis]